MGCTYETLKLCRASLGGRASRARVPLIEAAGCTCLWYRYITEGQIYIDRQLHNRQVS